MGSGRRSGTGRPRRRTTRARSSRRRWRTWSRTRSRRLTQPDLFEWRRRLMDDWSAYLDGGGSRQFRRVSSAKPSRRDSFTGSDPPAASAAACDQHVPAVAAPGPKTGGALPVMAAIAGAAARCPSHARFEPHSSGCHGGWRCDRSGRIGCDLRPSTRSQGAAATNGPNGATDILYRLRREGGVVPSPFRMPARCKWRAARGRPGCRLPRRLPAGPPRFDGEGGALVRCRPFGACRSRPPQPCTTERRQAARGEPAIEGPRHRPLYARRAPRLSISTRRNDRRSNGRMVACARW